MRGSYSMRGASQADFKGRIWIDPPLPPHTHIPERNDIPGWWGRGEISVSQSEGKIDGKETSLTGVTQSISKGAITG